MFFISHLLPDEEMKELIAATGFGVESIEFSVSENLDHLSQSLSAYEKRLTVMDCRRLILHGPFLDLNPMAFDQHIRQVTMLRYTQAYEAAKSLGAEKLIYHSCYLPQIYFPDGLAQRAADFFEDFLSRTDGSVTIAVENVFDTAPTFLRELTKTMDPSRFQLCFDVGHANCFSRIPVSEWISAMGPRTGHLHLHDNLGQEDSHLALGQGSLLLNDLRPLFDRPDLPTCTFECGKAQQILQSWDAFRRILPASLDKLHPEQ